MAKISKKNVRSQAVILPAKTFCFEIKAILASPKSHKLGFDPFCTWRRWQAPGIFQYARHLPPNPEQNGFKPRMSPYWVPILAFFILAGCGAQNVAPPVTSDMPKRIVSMNPCIDAILYEVAAPDQIASISHYSQDLKATSVPLDWARRYHANNGSAEDIIFAKPDLVIAGPHVSIETIDALKRLHIPLMVNPMPINVAEEKAQIVAIAKQIGRAEAGRALNARIDTALQRTRWNGASITALIWQGGGLVPGKDTLADELLSHSGFRNSSSDLGLEQWDILPLETMLARPPKILLSGTANMGESEGDANRMLSHPALKKAGAKIRIADFSSKLLNCGGPVIIRTVERLAEVRQTVNINP
jgi:iron complex transport system substrate-binding protein